FWSKRPCARPKATRPGPRACSASPAPSYTRCWRSTTARTKAELADVASAGSDKWSRLATAAGNKLERLACELHAIACPEWHDEPFPHLASVVPRIEPLGAARDPLVDTRTRELEDEIAAHEHHEDLALCLHRDTVRAPALLDRHALCTRERLDHAPHERGHH